MTWMDDAAKTYRSGGEPRRQCQVHDDHDRSHLVEVNLVGPCAAVPDFPAIQQRLATSFTIAVYDWEEYDAGRVGYCPGAGEVPRSIDLQGRWEGWFTLLALDILASGKPTAPVLDFGANAGWYTLLAASLGHPVLAIEGDADIVELLWKGIDVNQFADRVTVADAWIDDRTERLPRRGAQQRIRFVKIDVEGAEGDVIDTLDVLLVNRQIDHLLIEITPAFSGADMAEEMIEDLAAYGYEARFAPDKEWFGAGWMGTFEADPLLATLAQPPVEVGHFDRNPEQRTVLFSRVS